MKKNLSKTLSRLAAVQTCFQSFFDNQDINIVAKEFNKYRFKKILDINNINLNYDKSYFNELINYINNFNSQYNSNEYFKKFFNSKRPYKRLDIITKSILIVASSEILNNNILNKKILVNDYVEIAKSFFNKPEVSFINAILDNVYESKSKI